MNFLAKMGGRLAASVLCVLVCTPSLRAAQAEGDGYRIVGYVAGWATPAVIHPRKLTHINFAFARITSDGLVALANAGLETSLLRVLALRKVSPPLKVIISIGGWEADGDYNLERWTYLPEREDAQETR